MNIIRAFAGKINQNIMIGALGRQLRGCKWNSHVVYGPFQPLSMELVEGKINRKSLGLLGTTLHVVDDILHLLSKHDCF